MKKNIIFATLLLVLTSGNIFAQFDKYFENKSLRIDYIHSGNYKEESFKLEQLIEKDIWAGSRVNLIDAFDYGKYRIMVYDKAEHKLIYSRTYSTLFAEWRTTEEGKKIDKSFSETMLIPYPKKPVNIVFQSRDSMNTCQNVDSVYVDSKKDFLKKVEKNQNKVVKLHYSGVVCKKLDIVIIADGYALQDSTKMRKDLKRISSYILHASPFNKNKKKLNIWGVETVSEQSGINDPISKTFIKTAVGSSFNTIESDRYLMTLENKTLHNQLNNAQYEQIIIMCNTQKYGGGGIYNFYCAIAAKNIVANYLIHHEFGHSFAGLGDEYYTSEVTVENFYPVNIEPWEPNLTTLVNFGSKWNKMLNKKTPIPTPVEEKYEKIIGVYEGGGYVEKGVYRPFIDCTMKSLIYNSYCPVCTKATEDMIKFYSK